MTTVNFNEFSVHLTHDDKALFAPFSGQWQGGGQNLGKTIGLMGRSGIGKTCFLRALIGLPDGDARTLGSVMIDGKPVNESRAQGKIGMAFQQPGIIPWLSVRDNIAINERTSEETVNSLLSWLDLEKIRDRKAGACSGGQQSRTSFARSLAHKPTMLILDEPFTGVDLVTKDQILKCIDNDQVFDDKLVILVTHDISEIVHLADELWVIGSKGEGPRSLYCLADKTSVPNWSEQVLHAMAIKALVGRDQSTPQS